MVSAEDKGLSRSKFEYVEICSETLDVSILQDFLLNPVLGN
jgi:hypothetical protein